MDESLLIGETIVFSEYGLDKKALVMGVGVMKFQVTDIFPTTCYSVLVNGEGEIKHLPYWKIKGIVEPDIAFLELLVKSGDQVVINFPKYEKPAHPKGWAVDQESNDDLPM